MKTAVSILLILAVIVLFAQIVLQLGSYASTRTAKKPGHPVVEAASSSATMEGLGAAWLERRKNHSEID